MDTLVTRTDVHGKPVYTRQHFSFSRADKFYNCPRKFYHYDVAKDVSEPEGPAMLDGFKVHKAMADYISSGKPLPPEWAHYAEWPDNMIGGPAGPNMAGGQLVHVEHRLAMTYELKPCDYFSRRDAVWLRAQADLLVISPDGSHALSVDWKTGKEKDPMWEVLPPNFQLRLTAMLIFLHFPKVQHVTSKYVYLNNNAATSFDMIKDELREFIPSVYDLFGPFQRAFNKNQFLPRRSGLCRRFCAVTSCEFHGKGPNE